MARTAYEKTVWVDKSTPVNAANLNKIEDALSQVDSEVISLDGRVAGLEALGGSGEGATELVALREQVESLQEAVTGKADGDHTHTEFATYDAYEARIKALEESGLADALQSITDRLTALEEAMTTHTHETLAGETNAASIE